jgi:uncharacterized protein (DUF1800 family)
MGLPAYVAQMLQVPAPGVTTNEEAAADPILVNPTDPPGQEGMFPTQGQLAQWWQYLFQRNPNPFQEVLALFWHDHFAASNANFELDKTYWTKTHVNLWRDGGAGNLKTLGVAMARDWTMLLWLDGVFNTATFPNENFAREFYELFFLGVDQGYTQADIVEAARAWTGYRLRTHPVTLNLQIVEFNAARHDEGAKVIFGTTIPAQAPGAGETDDYDEMVDITFANRPVEDFIARKILAAFCYADPPDSVVSDLGALLRGGNWELAPVLTTLFLSEAFYSPTAKAGFVKSPVEHALSLIRSTGMRTDRRLNGGLATLGHVPTQPPTVNGWPVDEEWLAAQAMVDRANLANSILTDRTSQTANGFSMTSLLPPLPATTSQIVDHVALTLNVTITASERASYVTYLDTTAAGAVSAFNPSDPAHLDQRLRGLLYVLAQHPTFAVR